MEAKKLRSSLFFWDVQAHCRRRLDMVKHISGHSMRGGSAQDLMSSGASMPMLMNRGRWTKTDTVMRYVENAQVVI